MKQKKIKWKKYFIEFLSIFIGITLAFALDKWNEGRKEDKSEYKILLEIKNGLEQDLIDLADNINGHRVGIKTCYYFRDLIENKEVSKDSLERKYIVLFRDFISIQNKSGYESLKSKGLESISNDELRLEIISLYDFQYEIIEKLEEHYMENQFHENYFKEINNLLAENMVFDSQGVLIDIKQPIRISSKEKNIVLSYLRKIEFNRQYNLRHYLAVEEKVKKLIESIQAEINR